MSSRRSQKPNVAGLEVRMRGVALAPIGPKHGRDAASAAAADDVKATGVVSGDAAVDRLFQKAAEEGRVVDVSNESDQAPASKRVKKEAAAAAAEEAAEHCDVCGTTESAYYWDCDQCGKHVCGDDGGNNCVRFLCDYSPISEVHYCPACCHTFTGFAAVLKAPVNDDQAPRDACDACGEEPEYLHLCSVCNKTECEDCGRILRDDGGGWVFHQFFCASCSKKVQEHMALLKTQTS